MRDILLLILPLIGVGFGWVLNELSSFFSQRRENKKILNQVLSYLLELYYQLNKLDISKSIEKVVDDVAVPLLPKEEHTRENRNMIIKIFKQIIPSTLRGNVFKNISDIEVEYLESIKKLSRINPIEAYYLRGKTNIENIFSAIHDTYGELNNLLDLSFDDIEVNQIVKLANTETQSSIVNDLKDDLRENINIIAKRISKHTEKRVSKMLSTLNEGNFTQAEKDKMGELIGVIMKNVKI